MNPKMQGVTTAATTAVVEAAVEETTKCACGQEHTQFLHTCASNSEVKTGCQFCDNHCDFCQADR
jgi:hypothetical protein